MGGGNGRSGSLSWLGMAWALAVCVLASLGRAQAQEAVSIESPRSGSALTLASGTSGALPRPAGRAGFFSAVAGVRLMLQRERAGGWEWWSGSAWGSRAVALNADYDARAWRWAWRTSTPLPSGPSLTAGTYRLLAAALSSNGSVLGQASSTWSVLREVALVRADAPDNDLRENAVPIDGESGMVTGSSVDATGDWPDATSAAPNVWWKWTAPFTGTVTFDTVGSAFDTYLGVYLPLGDAVVHNDEDGLDGAARVSFRCDAGALYYISVGSGFAAGDVLTGAITLNWRPGEPSGQPTPANDSRFAAALLSGESGTTTGNSSYATPDWPGLPLPAPNVWWIWTATRAGNVTFDTRNSQFNTVLTVYDANFGYLASDDDGASGESTGASRVTMAVTPGTQLFISVSGYQAAVGPITLNWGFDDPNAARGRVLNVEGGGMSGVRVFLVPGDAIDPVLFAQGVPGMAAATTDANGAYSFPNLPAGRYMVLPMVRGTNFTPLAQSVTLPLANPAQSVDFRLGFYDVKGPELTVTSPGPGPFASGSAVKSIGGSVKDLNALGKAPTGTLAVLYVVYRLKSDAASMALPVDKRQAEAVFSKSAGRFVPFAANAPLARDSANFASNITTTSWRSGTSPALKSALAMGNYRLSALAIDNAFGTSAWAATHFEVAGQTKYPIIFLPGVAGSELHSRGRGKDIRSWIDVGIIAKSTVFPQADWDRLKLTSSGGPLSDITVYSQVKEPRGGAVGKHISGLDSLVNRDDFRGSSDFYDSFLVSLSYAGYSDNNLHAFGYDWRLSPETNGKRLGEKVTQVLRAAGTPNGKVILIGHSMGGLVARSYIQQSKGRNVRSMITIGTPFLGAAQAMKVFEPLGWSFNIPLLNPSLINDLCKNWPGAHSLLPGSDYYDLYATSGGFYLQQVYPKIGSTPSNRFTTKAQQLAEVRSFNPVIHDNLATWRRAIFDGNDYGVQNHVIVANWSNSTIIRYILRVGWHTQLASVVYGPYDDGGALSTKGAGDDTVPLKSGLLGKTGEGAHDTSKIGRFNAYILTSSKERYGHSTLCAMPEVKNKVSILLKGIQPAS